MATIGPNIARGKTVSPTDGEVRPHFEMCDHSREAATSRKSHRTSRPPLDTLTGVQILATGSYLPETVVRNEDLAALGCDADWIVQRSGIRERRHAEPDKDTGDLAYEAARRCIEQAGTDPADIDLLIVGTVTPARLMPATACELQERLGLTAPAMDVNAACAGFMYALVTAMHFVKCGSSRLALVVASDVLTRVVNKADRKTYPLFGDAAGAVLLGEGDDSQGLLAYTLGSDGSGADLLCIPAGGTREPLTTEAIAAGRHRVFMDGRPVFKWAVRLICDTVVAVLDKSQMTVDDLDLLIPHQANSRIIDAAMADLEIDPDKVIVNLDRYGNTSAASVPLALDEVYREGRIQRGDKILISGFGAGLTWGTAILQW